MRLSPVGDNWPIYGWIACFASLLIACQAERVDQPAAQPRTNDQEVVAALKTAARGELDRAGQGPIEVRGYEFHWQLEAEDDTRLVIVSRNLGGSLLAFSPDGQLLAERECDEITSVQWMDLDLDGKPEWITVGGALVAMVWVLRSPALMTRPVLQALLALPIYLLALLVLVSAAVTLGLISP